MPDYICLNYEKGLARKSFDLSNQSFKDNFRMPAFHKMDYSQITIKYIDKIKSGTSCGDSKVVGQKWRYANVDGSRDMRRNNNEIIYDFEVGHVSFEYKNPLENYSGTSSALTKCIISKSFSNRDKAKEFCKSAADILGCQLEL